MSLRQIDRYPDEVQRSESMDFDQITERLQEVPVIRGLHAAMGVATEAGELVDAFKKYVFYGKEWDEKNLKEEAGDLMWYIQTLCNAMGWNLEDIMTMNIEKLKIRYPEQFSSEFAINRNLDLEYEALK